MKSGSASLPRRFQHVRWVRDRDEVGGGRPRGQETGFCLSQSLAGSVNIIVIIRFGMIAEDQIEHFHRECVPPGLQGSLSGKKTA